MELELNAISSYEDYKNKVYSQKNTDRTHNLIISDKETSLVKERLENIEPEDLDETIRPSLRES